jgi:hypothetical protein
VLGFVVVVGFGVAAGVGMEVAVGDGLGVGSGEAVGVGVDLGFVVGGFPLLSLMKRVCCFLIKWQKSVNISHAYSFNWY